MLFCPESDAAADPTTRGTWPANTMPRSRARRAIAKYVSAVSCECTLMKSTPSATSESTPTRASAALRASRCGIGTSPPSRYGPDAMMRGPTSRPRAISLRHVVSVAQSPAMSRTPVTPFAT